MNSSSDKSAMLIVGPGIGRPAGSGGQQGNRNFDARQKLGPKAVVDARDKIITIKKSGGGDARNKIVQMQVQKGTFDARSLLQRQAQKGGPQGKKGAGNQGGKGSGGPLMRTLSNPNAKGRAQVKVTNSGLQVTRPIPSTQVSLSGSSLQVSKRMRPFEPNKSAAVPIIQIRNDRYRQPLEPPPGRPSQPAPYPVSYTKPSPYPAYDSPNYSPYPSPAFSSQRGYRDLDNPEYNEASIAAPEIPKVHISNLRPIEAAGMRPVSYSPDYPPPPRVPPGAARLSQSAKVPISKTVLQPARLTQAGVKRKPPPQEVSGPLRLGKGGGPGIDLAIGSPSPSKKSKVTGPVQDLEVIDLEETGDVISPLQGFRVMVTNLFNGVTQDDIIELFGAVGPLKKAKLLKPGTAEVVYVSRENASSAVQKYHSRELDGQPMYVKMTTPVAAMVKQPLNNDPDITGEALRLYKKGSGMGSLPEAPIEIPTIHRALFKAGPPGPNKSVKFTVKI